MTDAGDDLRASAADEEGQEQSPTFATAIEDLLSDVRRHGSDRAIYVMLRDSGFRADYWDLLAEQLVRYGFRVLLGWLRTGKIVHKCVTQGHGSPNLPAWLMSDDREAQEIRQELVWETLANGLVIFRGNLESGRWDPDAGRSLATYFVAACVYAFPNVLRRWRNGEARWEKAKEALFREAAFLVEPRFHPFSVVDAAVTLESLVADEDEQDANVIRLLVDGFTQVEIAHVLGMNDGAVHRVVRRWRSRTKARLVEGETSSESSS